MTLAPCFAASPMYLACFSIIESLSPVHEHWTNAALTGAMSRSPLIWTKDGPKQRFAPSRRPNLYGGAGVSRSRMSTARGVRGYRGMTLERVWQVAPAL